MWWEERTLHSAHGECIKRCLSKAHCAMWNMQGAGWESCSIVHVHVQVQVFALWCVFAKVGPKCKNCRPVNHQTLPVLIVFLSSSASSELFWSGLLQKYWPTLNTEIPFKIVHFGTTVEKVLHTSISFPPGDTQPQQCVTQQSNNSNSYHMMSNPNLLVAEYRRYVNISKKQTFL